MVILILERVSTGLRGELSRWLIEPRAGVFIGRVSALVRDRLWEKVSLEYGLKGECGGMMIHAARTEQGYIVRSVGDPTREVLDWEGLALIRAREEGAHQRRLRKARERRERSEAGPPPEE